MDLRISFGCDYVREIKVPFLKTAHSNSVIVCSYGVIMYITCTHVVPNTNELLSSVEHKRRCETEWYSQSPFTFIVGKKRCNASEWWLNLTVFCLVTNIAFCVPRTWVNDDRFFIFLDELWVNDDRCYIFRWNIPLNTEISADNG